MANGFPASATALGRVVQSSDGPNTELYTVPSAAAGYHLGAGLTPPQPGTWVNVPDGAFPITPPGAPTTGTGTGFAGGGLTANGAYAWALSSITDYGETPAGPQLVVPNVGNYTGYILNLPAVTEGTTDNPVRKRRLYRTANGGAQLKYVTEIGDLNLTTWHDALPDLQLGDNVPTSNASGVTGTVTLSGGGVTVWTERSPTLAQGAMASGDFVVNRQTGNIVHATSDYARTGVTVVWSGATLDTAQLVRDHIAAVRDIAAAAGANNGLPTLNGSGAVVQDPASKGQASGVARLDASKNLVIENGGRLTVPAQTGNTSATYVPNLTLGWFGLPAGNAAGSTVVVSNAAVTANSAILLQVQGNPGADNVLTPKVCARVAGVSFSFTVKTLDAAVTSAAVDILYLIVN